MELDRECNVEMTADDRETLVVHIHKASTWLDLNLLRGSPHTMMMIVPLVFPGVSLAWTPSTQPKVSKLQASKTLL